MVKKQKRLLARILLSALLLATGFLLQRNAAPLPLSAALLCVAYLLAGYDILRRAALGLLRGRLLDENFLMAVATVGAFTLAVWEKSYDFSEAVTVMVLYQTGELFESIAVGKSRRSIGALMDIRPEYATLEEAGGRRRVSPDAVPVGSIITVEPGERIPLDGVVLSGESSLDTRALTGESLPRSVHPGDTVQNGCINEVSLLRIQTTGLYADSTVSRILALVENASSRKSRSEAFISRFARIYTPTVCLLALAVAVLPPLLLPLFGGTAAWTEWIHRALSFLVISCPCALVISIPLSFFAGIGGAGHRGILIKGSNYLELLAKVDTVVFDKTGTLTAGVFAVTRLHPVGMTEAELLRYAALAEANSTHPIARSICDAAALSETIPASAVEERRGKGVLAQWSGKTLAVGNTRLLADLGIAAETPDAPGTAVHLAVDGVYGGYILISDAIKSGSAEAIAALRRVGVRRTVLLTGDNRAVAESVGSQLGLDGVQSELLPGDKVSALETLLRDETAGRKLVFVGDGINDAPTLMRADIGVAMGVLGSDAAIEAADVVLMDDDPRKLATAIRLSRKCLRIVRENLVFTLAVKILCLALTAAGLADMWLAIFADVGVMVLAVLNALRAMRL